MAENLQVHFRAMKRALRLALRGRGRVEPNPMVGCVLLRDGVVIGEGFHKKFGGPHAEIEALENSRKKGGNPAGCDVVVTLEPCCHFGKTGPCVDALIAAKVGRVFVAMQDPFEKVAGRGLAKLREAGIAVEVGLCEAEAREMNAPFIKRVTRGLPWVIGKWAATLDGKIATASGNSQWISNADSRREVHELRSRVDAVMTGIGTVLADDPQLTARDVKVLRNARRVVVDPSLRISLQSQLITSLAKKNAPPVTIAMDEKILEAGSEKITAMRELGVELFGLPSLRARWRDDREALDLKPLLAHLSQHHQATNVLVEGGAGLMGALLEQKLLDALRVYVAPKIVGDARAISPVRGLECVTMEQAMRLQLRSVREIAGDVVMEYFVN